MRITRLRVCQTGSRLPLGVAGVNPTLATGTARMDEMREKTALGRTYALSTGSIRARRCCDDCLPAKSSWMSQIASAMPWEQLQQ